METNIKIGDKIKSFEIKNIVDGIGFKYTNEGKKIPYKTKYMLLLSDSGQERVLEIGKTNLNQCKMYKPTFSRNFRFIKWNQLKTV